MTALHAAGGGLPLALHIPHVVEQVGSIAGFAAIIGLAVLSALYFSQARDLRRLREWAGRAPERAAEGQPAAVVPGRVVAVPQQQRPQQAGPAPAPATPAAAAPSNGEEAKTDGAKPEQPVAATNGDAAPSVAAAEASKDGAETSKDEQEGAKEEEAPAAKPGMPAPASAAAAAAGAGTKSVSAPAAPAAGGAAAGAAAAAGSAAAPPKPAAPQAPGSAGPGAPSGPRPAAQPQRPPSSVLPPRTGTLPPVRRLPSSNVSPAQTGGLDSAPPPKKKRNPVYVVLAVAGVLVLGAAAAVGVPALINGSDDDGSPSSSTAKKSDTAATKKKQTAATSPDKITVAVLNGTGIPGLAAQVGDRVDAEGFTLGTVSNASPADGQRANSVAMYSSGHKPDAEQVAKKLNIRDVTRVDANSQAIAGDASVVVIVGSDKTQ
jgi:LytR cell envelope-related transcriptional attenuator